MPVAYVDAAMSTESLVASNPAPHVMCFTSRSKPVQVVNCIRRRYKKYSISQLSWNKKVVN